MNLYTPIQHTAPGWGNARAVVAQYLPDALRIAPEQIDASIMTLDWSWAVQIMRLTPYGYEERMLGRLGRLNDRLLDVLPHAEILSSFLGKMVTQRRLNGMTDLLAVHDLDRKAVGLATSIEMIRHEMGIEQCLLAFEPLPVSHSRLNQWRGS